MERSTTIKLIGIAGFTRMAIVLILFAAIFVGCAVAPPRTSGRLVGTLGEHARPGDVPAEMLEWGTPEYPDVAVANGIEGTFIVDVLVTEDGKTSAMKVKKRELNKYKAFSFRFGRWVDVTYIFDASAYDMLHDAKWKPSIRDGRPIAAWVRIPLIFQLKN